MRRFLASALLLMSVSLANAQAPTPLCIPGTSPTSGQPTCAPVNGSNPLPISGSFSANLTGFLSNNLFATLTATNVTSASTALPTGATPNPSVRITNNGTTVISCTMATGAATGVASNILVQPGSSVSRVVGTFDHIACIDQTGSISNPVVIEGGSGLGNDSGGGGSGGGGSSITIWAGGTLGAMANYGTSPGAVLVPGMNSFITNTPTVSVSNWAGGLLGAMSNYGTSPGAVLVPGVNAFITNTNNNGQATMANSSPVAIASNQSTLTTQRGNDYPVGSTPITASATGTTAATAATLAASGSGLFTYMCSLSVRSNATTATQGHITMTGLATNFTYAHWTAPVASGIGVTEMIFIPCVKSSAINTAIVVTSPAAGTNGDMSVNLHGYQGN